MVPSRLPRQRTTDTKSQGHARRTDMAPAGPYTGVSLASKRLDRKAPPPCREETFRPFPGEAARQGLFPRPL